MAVLVSEQSFGELPAGVGSILKQHGEAPSGRKATSSILNLHRY
jgi:hypothetical protein